MVTADTGNAGYNGVMCNGLLKHYQLKPADDVAIQENSTLSINWTYYMKTYCYVAFKVFI